MPIAKYRLETYESVIVAPTQAKEDAFVAETRNVCEHTICARRERCLVLQTTLGDVAECAIASSLLVGLQALDRIVRVSRKREF
tara:strand:+ start:10990 stop:11241 length:252 start_codon:yes stop_codon:yes gene_type:complete